MPRKDGEYWLEGRPFGEATEASEESRNRLQDPRWWLVLVVVAPIIGFGSEAITAALGDGDFTVRAALKDALLAFLSVVTGTVIISRL